MSRALAARAMRRWSAITLRYRFAVTSGATLSGKVIAKAALAGFATQRDVSRRKRDIKTIGLKLKVDNPDGALVPGMTAEVLLPKDLATRKVAEGAR